MQSDRVERCEDTTIVPFSNEIDDLPPPNTYRRKRILEVPPEIQVELEKTKETRELEFKRWLIHNKPKEAVMTPIETSTATGVPDIFCCYNGFSSWIECKIVSSGASRFRGTQYVYLKKLIEAGGHAKLVVQHLNNNYKPASIHIYDAAKVIALPIDLFKKSGKELILPPKMEPWYIWKYNKPDSYPIEELYQRLLLDTQEFTW